MELRPLHGEFATLNQIVRILEMSRSLCRRELPTFLLFSKRAVPDRSDSRLASSPLKRMREPRILGKCGMFSGRFYFGNSVVFVSDVAAAGNLETFETLKPWRCSFSVNLRLISPVLRCRPTWSSLVAGRQEWLARCGSRN